MREFKFRAWDAKYNKMMSNQGSIRLLFAKSCGKSREHKVMQYTSLKDKNGNDIYEGDILEQNTVSGTIRYKVVFLEGRFAQDPLDGIDIPDIWDCWDDLKVIGNIFENPELLKK